MSRPGGRASGVSADNAMALFALQAAADAGEPRVRPESLAGLATAPGFSSPTPPASPNIACRAEQAGIAQGAQFVEADAGEDFHAAQPISAAQGLLQLAGTAGRALAPTVEALDDAGSRRCLDIALAELAFELGEEVLHVRSEAPQLTDDQLEAAAENARRYRPRLDQFARVRCRCRARPAPLCRDDRAGKAPGAPCRSASPHGRSCPAARRLRGRPARRWRSWAGSAARRSARRRGFSRSPRDHRYPASACPSAPRRTHARLQHLLNARQPAVGEGPGRPRCSTARRRRRFSALSSTTSRRTPCNHGCAPPGAAAG